MSKEVSYHSHYGPGGRYCNCCGPAPKHRKKHDRVVKKRMKIAAMKEELKSLTNLNESLIHTLKEDRRYQDD